MSDDIAYLQTVCHVDFTSTAEKLKTHSPTMFKLLIECFQRNLLPSRYGGLTVEYTIEETVKRSCGVSFVEVSLSQYFSNKGVLLDITDIPLTERNFCKILGRPYHLETQSPTKRSRQN